MSGKIDDRLRLNHIYDAIISIDEFVDEIPLDKFLKNDLIISAVIRKLEIIGEASNHLSEGIISKYYKVSWNQIIGLRNIIAP